LKLAEARIEKILHRVDRDILPGQRQRRTIASSRSRHNLPAAEWATPRKAGGASIGHADAKGAMILRKDGGLAPDRQIWPMDEVWDLIANPETADAGLQILRDRCAETPFDPKPRFDLASAYDMLDRGAEAELTYEEVRALGFDRLSARDRSRWFVQYGSTLRLRGKLDASRAILLEGETAFPHDTAISAFRALTEMAGGCPEMAARVLLAAILRSDSAEVAYYRRALTHYVAALDEAIGALE